MATCPHHQYHRLHPHPQPSPHNFQITPDVFQIEQIQDKHRQKSGNTHYGRLILDIFSTLFLESQVSQISIVSTHWFLNQKHEKCILHVLAINRTISHVIAVDSIVWHVWALVMLWLITIIIDVVPGTWAWMDVPGVLQICMFVLLLMNLSEHVILQKTQPSLSQFIPRNSLANILYVITCLICITPPHQLASRTLAKIVTTSS